MRRKQLIELEDMSWCPRSIRDGGTDWLAFVANHGGLFTAAIPTIRAAMSAGNTNVVLDLCSGAGGPWRGLAPALAKDEGVRIILSDRYPNERALSAACDAAGPGVEYWPGPLDATRVPANLVGVRTMFNAFHHFPFEPAKAVLADAVAAHQPIAVFEPAARRWSGWVAMPLQMIAIFLLTPFVRPFRWSRLFFTYVIPLIPFLVLWDGIVSFLRLYGQNELQDLISVVPNHALFHWEIGSLRVTGLPWRIAYFVGVPKQIGVPYAETSPIVTSEYIGLLVANAASTETSGAEDG